MPMKRLALLLIAVLLLTLPVGAQENAILPDSFSFDFSGHVAVDGLDTFDFAALLGGSGAVDRTAHAFAVKFRGSTNLGTMAAVPVDEELRLVDDTLYLRAGEGEGWQAREDALDYLTELIAHFTLIDADSAALGAWNLSGIDPAVSALFDLITSPEAVSTLSAERLDDEGGNAHYQTTLDLHALMQTEAFVDAIAALANAQGTMLMTYERPELADLLRANSAMFAGSTAVLDTYVGLGDNLLYRAMLNIALLIDPGQADYPNPDFIAAFKLDVTLHNLNQPQDITAPESVQAVTDFSFPVPPAPEAAGDGVTQHIFFARVEEGGTAEQTFDALAGDIVTLTVSGLDWTFDSIMTLLSPEGETLAENDDHEMPSFALGDYQSQILDFEIPADGTYTVQVADLNGAAGNFVLSITTQR
jgi:hypothetical protein